MKFSGQFISVTAVSAALIIGAALAITTLPNSDAAVSAAAPGVQVLPHTKDGHKPRPSGTSSGISSTRKDTFLSNAQAETTQCLGPCLNAAKLLTHESPIDDDTYEKLTGLAEGLAAYLELNKSARMDMLDLVLTTEDSNKRALLMDAFALLPLDQREALGQGLALSENWKIRTDGINLSMTPQTMTTGKAETLFQHFTAEPHPHVKATVLSVLKNAESLKGDTATLENLSNIMRTETDAGLKSKALLTKLALQEDPLAAMPDALMALNSGEPEFQQSALIALNQLYEAERVTEGGLDRIDHRAIKRGIERFQNIRITPENKADVQRLLDEAERFYQRHD